MCYQFVERYSECRCLYYRHAVNPCEAYGQRGHYPQEKTDVVGYACPTLRSGKADAEGRDDEILREGLSESTPKNISYEGKDHIPDHQVADFKTSYNLYFSNLSVTAGGRVVLVDWVASRLSHEPSLRELWLTVLPKLNSPDFAERTVRYIVSLFAIQLQVGASSNVEHKVSRFIRTRSRYLTRTVCNANVERVRFMPSPLSARVQRIAVASLNSTDATEGSYSELEDVDLLSDDEAKEILDEIGHVRSFLLEGQPFESFKENLQCFIEPSEDLDEPLTALTELRTIGEKNVPSVWQCIQSCLQKLPTLLQEGYKVPQGKTRLYWTCVSNALRNTICCRMVYWGLSTARLKWSRLLLSKLLLNALRRSFRHCRMSQPKCFAIIASRACAN